MQSGDRKALARAITLVENDLPGAQELLLQINFEKVPPVIGVTGPPGAGKSTLINALITKFTSAGERIAVIAIDPTSPFTSGSLLGDRLRMPEHFNNPLVFIRSLATRGSLGGLSAKAIEITDLIRTSGFDRIIVETVGVGQSEVEIAGLADITILVLVPESGDDIQALKSGIMEIADIYVINKSDRPGADQFAMNIQHLVHNVHDETQVRMIVKTVASSNQGLDELMTAIQALAHSRIDPQKRTLLYAEKAWKLISQSRMKDLSKQTLTHAILSEVKTGQFHLYRFCTKYTGQ